MSAFVLGSIDPLPVSSFSGFDLPDDVSVVSILGDGTSDFNAVLQSPGTGLPSAQLAGVTTDPAVIAALRALRLSEDLTEFTEPDGSHWVVVAQLSVNRVASSAALYRYNITIIELEEMGS